MKKLLHYSAKKNRFVPLDMEEAKRLEELFRADFNASKWRKAGFIIEHREEGIVALRERRNRGHGFYLFRPAAPRPLFLQMPHSFSDIGSEEIGFRLFQQGGFQGAAWNTRHRKDTKNSSSDLAHITNSPFTAQGLAVAARWPAAVVIQLHGFSQKKRRTSAAQNADFIISSGTRAPSIHGERLATCLQQKKLGGVMLYGRDLYELGGTTNTTGRALRSMGFNGFLHLEMSKGLRQRLLDEPLLMEKVGICLSGL